MTSVTVECGCGHATTYPTALKDDQLLLGNAALVDTLLMAFDAHDCPDPETPPTEDEELPCAECGQIPCVENLGG